MYVHINSYYISNLIVSMLFKYSRSVSATCLRNKPDVIIPRWKKLPGKLLNRDEQCGKIFPEYVSVRYFGKFEVTRRTCIK